MTATDGYLMIALFALPLATGLLLMITPSRERGAIIGITGIASLVMFVLSVYLFNRYDYTSTEHFQGVVAWDVEVTNQDNEPVAVYTILTLVRRLS